MTFTKLNLIEVHRNPVILHTNTEVILTSNILSYRTKPLWTNPMYIMYRITKMPMYGSLVLHSKHRMHIGHSFTQEDINSNNIIYKLYRRSFSNFTDSVTFSVSAPGCEHLRVNITFTYNSGSELSSKVRAQLKPIQVDEGSKVNITAMNLNLTIDTVKEFTFNITQKPKHGVILVTDKNLPNNSVYFTSQDLLNNAVIYVHDDSESQNDAFKFLALSKENENVQYSGEIYIDILLKNDNSPVRKVDKVLHVVTGGKKLITSDDFSYSDADIDTKPSNIVYSCREVPNGALYRVNGPDEQIFEFNQEDLNNKAILFKHRGESYGKIKFWVSDGQFNVNGYLEVQASNPFIKVLKPRKHVLEQNKSILITSEELQVVTNLNTKDDNIVYEVINRPQYGKIILGNSDQVSLSIL